jgi:hypothetical protein
VVGLQSGAVEVTAGTKHLLLRYAPIEEHEPSLQSLFPESDLDPWSRKVVVCPTSVGVTPADERDWPVTEAYIIRALSRQQRLHRTQVDGLGPRLYLHEDFCRYIRGTATPFVTGEGFEFSGYIPSLDCPRAYRQRAALIDTLLHRTRMQHLSGPLAAVVKGIAHVH